MFVGARRCWRQQLEIGQINANNTNRRTGIGYSWHRSCQTDSQLSGYKLPSIYVNGPSPMWIEIASFASLPLSRYLTKPPF